MSLSTPEKIRSLQRKLYVAAKEEPKRRFHQLYDKVCREDVLAHAYRLAKSHGGAAGVDGVSFRAIESQGLEAWLARLGQDLRERTYRPDPVKRVLIPKPGGGQRPLGIPTVRDRVAQTAAKLVLEPIFEADLEDSAYGYRPGRTAQQAVQAVHQALCQGFGDVVDADLSKYFDTIPHDQLMRSVARRVVDHGMLALVKSWLQAPVQVEEERGKKRMEGGKGNHRGTPQGGVLSPLLANIYMNRFLRHWRQRGRGAAFRARIVNYADDFVILSRGHAAQARAWTQRVMTALGLTLNEHKTCLRDARRESFDFLGYTFGPEHYRKDGHWYLAAKPSRKSMRRLRQRVRDELRPGNQGPWPEVAQSLNRVLRGWANYFSYGTRFLAYRAMDRHVVDRVRHFLRRRHKVPSRGTRQLSYERLYGELGVLRLQALLG